MIWRAQPLKHDCITGPAEEFHETDPDIDYPLVNAGDPFLRLGVGYFRKTDSAPFQRFHAYPFHRSRKLLRYFRRAPRLAPGHWHIAACPDCVAFKHIAG